MIKAIFDELEKEQPKNHFTIGIYDDVTHSSLEWDENFRLPHTGRLEALFYGLGSDGTVSANKSSIKIIGQETQNYVQGYFVYDSNKSGSMTTSHLRFGPDTIRSPYLIKEADFIACHQSVFLEKLDILRYAKKGAIFLLNSPFAKEILFSRLPYRVQEQIIQKELRLFAIDAAKVANASGLSRRINSVMQSCFFAITEILPIDAAMEHIKKGIEKSYAHKGHNVVEMNFTALKMSLENLFEIEVPKEPSGNLAMRPLVQGDFDAFVKDITATIIAGDGDMLKVSQIPADGTWPSGTTQYQKRNIALEVPVWNPDICIQCNKCVAVCPHATIRSKVVDESELSDAANIFSFVKAKGFEESDSFTIQVAVEDCTGCALCVEVCPAKDKEHIGQKAINMTSQEIAHDTGVQNWDYFNKLPYYDREKLDHTKLKESQFLEPLFEFSGACPGCGETPYIKLASQLFGDRMIIANATGCSSIYGGNLPTTPWKKNSEGRGPAWSNSLFEDNAEFGLGFRLAIDTHTQSAKEQLENLSPTLEVNLVSELLNATQTTESEIFAQRKRVEKLKNILAKRQDTEAKKLLTLADYLVKKSLWIIGGDGWAYDIGYGGLDHVIASGKNVNILVLDTQVYSNTGGQQSKATMIGAIAKFAASGKTQTPKDLAMMAISYENVYVAKVAMGANDAQTLKAFMEAEAYDGPSIIIAYSHCVAHGYDLKYGMAHQKLAVESGLWPLFRYNPALKERGQNPMHLDYKGPIIDVENFMYQEPRFKMVEKIDQDRAHTYLEHAREYAQALYKRYTHLANMPL